MSMSSLPHGKPALESPENTALVGSSVQGAAALHSGLECIWVVRPPVAGQNVGEAVAKRVGLPALDAAAVNVRRVGGPVTAGLAKPEAVCVGQRRVQVDRALLVLRVGGRAGVQRVEEGRCSKNICMGSGFDLRTGPAGNT
jgi:hypothetical protein